MLWQRVVMRSALARQGPLKMYTRTYSDRMPFNRPGPMPLPKEEQQEFERLLKEQESAFYLSPQANYRLWTRTTKATL